MYKKIPFKIDKSKGRDALRLAIQSAIAAVITYIIMSSFKLPELFLGLLSAVLIVEPSAGSTFNQAKSRILATLIGSAIGFACVTVTPWGFGTAISIAIVVFIMNGITAFKSEWKYGVVVSMAVALGSENNAIDTSIDRIIAISIGAAIGILVSFIVWRDRTNKRSRRYLNNALLAASERFDIAVSNTRKIDNEEAEDVKSNYHKNIDLAEKTAIQIQLGDKEKVLNQIGLTKKLYNSIIIVHRVSEHAESNISDGDSGIENDSEKAWRKACEITKALALDKEIKDKDVEVLEEMIEILKDNVKNSEDNKGVNTLRYTFIFGLSEIKDSLKSLIECTYDENYLKEVQKSQ